MARSGVHPHCLVLFLLFKLRVGDDNLMLCTQGQEHHGIRVLLPDVMMADDTIPGSTVDANTIVKVTQASL